MFKKALSLLLAASITSALSVTSFAGRGSTKIVPYGHDEDDVYEPNSKEVFSLEDGSEDSLTDGVDDIKNYDLEIEDLDVNGSDTDYTVKVKPEGTSYNLIVESDNFPDEDDLEDHDINPDSYAEEISFRIVGTKTLDDDTDINMSSRTIHMSFGYGNVTTDDLKYELHLDETDVEPSDDEKDISAGVRDARYVPGKIYYFDLYRGAHDAILDEDDYRDYSIRASAYYKSSIFKRCEIVEKSNGNLQLMVQADPEYDFEDPHFGKIKLSIYPKGNTRKRMDTYWEIGFQYAEDDVKSDTFHIDEEKPIVCLPDWVEKATAEVENVADIEFYAIDTRKFNLSYDRDEIKAINDKNKGADTEYLTFHAAPKFEGTAKILYNVDRNSYVYEIGSNNELTQIDAKYTGGKMTWSDKVLGSYVISDSKLDATGTVITEPEEEKPATPEQTPQPQQPQTPVQIPNTNQNTNQGTSGKLVPTGALR